MSYRPDWFCLSCGFAVEIGIDGKLECGCSVWEPSPPSRNALEAERIHREAVERLVPRFGDADDKLRAFVERVAAFRDDPRPMSADVFDLAVRATDLLRSIDAGSKSST